MWYVDGVGDYNDDGGVHMWEQFMLTMDDGWDMAWQAICTGPCSSCSVLDIPSDPRGVPPRKVS